MPRLTSKNPPAPRKRSKKAEAADAGPTAKETLRTGSEGEPPHAAHGPVPAKQQTTGEGLYIAAVLSRLDAIERRLGTLGQEIGGLHGLLSKPTPPPLSKDAPVVTGAPAGKPAPIVVPSLDLLKERVTALLTAGQRQRVVDALTSLGVSRTSDLPEADRARFLGLLN